MNWTSLKYFIELTSEKSQEAIQKRIQEIEIFIAGHS